MNFKDVRPGQIFEYNMVYNTEHLLILSKEKNKLGITIVNCVSEADGTFEFFDLDKDRWSKENYELIVNIEELRERRRDFIYNSFEQRDEV
jgi:hypothetical protein